jgi:hypothetical protein
VSDTVSVIVAHHLGKVEAVRRLKGGLARANGHLGGMISMEQDTWQGDTLCFRILAFGQTASASIEVLEEAKVAKSLLPILRKEATRLLEKK